MEERQRLLLGALLHDIGKVMQRAEVPLSASTQKMESVLCPTAPGGVYSHRHVLWTYEAFETFLRDVPGLSVGENSVANIACFHHRPTTAQQKIVQEADRLSSGLDRVPDDSEAKHRQSYKKERLISVFSFVNLSRQPSWSPQRYSYNITALSTEPNAIFPRVESDLDPPHGASLVGEYARLWYGSDSFQGLTSELQSCLQKSDGFALDAVLAVLERYLWCVPSSTVDLADISLYDHLKTTAAISQCLYDSEDAEEPFLLLSGDVSGIQRFIYRAARAQGVGGIARRLRGRSLYITLLPEAFCRSLLSRTGGSSASILFCGGGRFEMLLPNCRRVRDLLDSQLSAFNSWLFSEFGGDICLVVAGIALTRQAILDYSAQRAKLEQEIEVLKRRKFIGIVSKPAEPAEEELGGQVGVCASCQSAIVRRGRILCAQCESQQVAGQMLPRTELLVFAHGEAYVDAPYLNYGPAGMVYLLDKADLAGRVMGTRAVSAVLALNNSCSGYGTKMLGVSVPVATMRFSDELAEEVYEPGDVIGFETLGELATGDHKLGVLAMDVDHLGLIFSYGLEGEGTVNRSVARISTLSRMLDLFFSGYLSTLCQRVSEGRHTGPADGLCYLLYSGGDDLVCVAPWDVAVDLAIKIRDDFSAYTCDNPNISISAGMTVVKPKFPISRAISFAKQSLEEGSKRQGRDRFTLFGDTMPWKRQQDQPCARELVEIGRILSQNAGDTIPRGFLSTLLRVHRQHFDGQWLDLAYIVKLVYQISRNIDFRGVMKDGSNTREYLFDKFVSGTHSKSYFKMLRVPVVYALMTTRDGGIEKWRRNQIASKM